MHIKGNRLQSHSTYVIIERIKVTDQKYYYKHRRAQDFVSGAAYMFDRPYRTKSSALISIIVVIRNIGCICTLVCTPNSFVNIKPIYF